MNEYNLPYSLRYCAELLARELSEKHIWYEGDISDFGNEVGYALGKVIENMTDEQITDFIHGIQHGISLTNGTH
jgi:hypothetical protein